jgi:tRNA G46 methylase TrmB
MPHRRNAYEERLQEFPEFAFGNQQVFQRRGQWHDFFRQRIGEKFDGRIVFEIGCSDADLLSRVAVKYPHRAFVGLDWKFKTLYAAAERVAREKLLNVALLRGRAQDVRQIFADGELDEIWLFHPDPCDKPAELQNRLVSPSFLTDVHRVLRGATSSLCLKTDHPGYYQWVLGLLGLPEPAWFQPAREAVGSDQASKLPLPRVKWREIVPRDQVPVPSDSVQKQFDVTVNSPDFWNDPAALAATSKRAFSDEITFFESRFLKKRLPIYYLEFTKRSAGRDVAIARLDETHQNGLG